jgi:hypothetical protein
LPDAIAGAVGDAGRNHPAIAVAEQHDVVQIFISDDVQHISDVGFEIDRRIGQMRPLAETRVGRRHQAMPGRAHQGMQLFPGPAGRPGAVADQEDFGGGLGHRALP